MIMESTQEKRLFQEHIKFHINFNSRDLAKYRGISTVTQR